VSVVRKTQELIALAEKHGIKTYRRMFIDTRTDDGHKETRFIDVPLSKADLTEQLREVGAL
jgi:uncharacterized protein (DUF1684 family)